MRAPQLVEVASLQPGQCFTCGGIAGPLVDTMVDLPIDGRVYICVATCLVPMAALAGLGPVAPLEQVVADAEEAIASLEARLEEQQPFMDAMALLKVELPAVKSGRSKVAA